MKFFKKWFDADKAAERKQLEEYRRLMFQAASDDDLSERDADKLREISAAMGKTREQIEADVLAIREYLPAKKLAAEHGARQAARLKVLAEQRAHLEWWEDQKKAFAEKAREFAKTTGRASAEAQAACDAIQRVGDLERKFWVLFGKTDPAILKEQKRSETEARIAEIERKDSAERALQDARARAQHESEYGSGIIEHPPVMGPHIS